MAAAVVNILAGFGNPLEEFDQTARAQSANIAAGQVDDGFCRGVCTDWLRRVIQGGKPWYDPAERRANDARAAHSDEEAERRRVAQTMRMGNVQLNTGGGLAVPATTRQARLRSVRTQLVQIYNPNRQLQTLTVPADVIRSLQEFFQINISADGRYNTATILDLINRLLAQITPNDPDLSFGAVAQTLDGQFNQARAEAGRNPTNKPFSGITPTLTETQYVSYAGFAPAINAITTAAGFDNGCGQIAGFQIHLPNGGLSGHAVAMYRYNNNSYDFFDPNYGIFRYSRAGLGQAIDHLFRIEYQTNGWRVLVNGMCGMRRQVFRRT
jgi:hypothetical protein